jgi:hypothetical protein
MNNLLTLQKQFTPLNNIKLKEPINKEVLDKLINSNLLKTTFNNPTSKIFFENEKEQLIKFRKLINKDGYAEILYKTTKGMNFGRCNPEHGLGLYNLRRQIRQSLATNNFMDIDIENCHPVIYCQILQKNNIECNNLKLYVENREQLLKDVINAYKVERDDAKQLFISLLYGGGFKAWSDKLKLNNAEPLEFLTNFKNELKINGDIIVNNNIDIVKEVKKRKEEQNKHDFNLNSSVVSYYLQEYERRILETIYNYCIEKGYIRNNIAVLCADGLMLEKQFYKIEL